MYSVFMVFSLPKTVVKTLVKTLVRNPSKILVKNLAQKLSEKLTEDCAKSMLKTSKVCFLLLLFFPIPFVCISHCFTDFHCFHYLFMFLYFSSFFVFFQLFFVFAEEPEIANKPVSETVVCWQAAQVCHRGQLK